MYVAMRGTRKKDYGTTEHKETAPGGLCFPMHLLLVHHYIIIISTAVHGLPDNVE
jgi:hypothetical protein